MRPLPLGALRFLSGPLGVLLLLGCAPEPSGGDMCEGVPFAEIDNEAACFGDGGMPECQCNETIICGHVKGNRWYDRTLNPISDPFVRLDDPLGKRLFLATDPDADQAFGGYLLLIVQPDGAAWCKTYFPVELGYQIMAQCTEDPPSSRVEYVDDNRITFRIDGVAVVDEGERLSVCDHEPVDGSLKGCANLPGVGALLRQ
jgi:hypothetical protein